MVRSLLFAGVLLPLLCVCLIGCPDDEHKAGDLAVFAGIEFVWCPSGWFYMGQLDDGLDHTQCEVPRVFVVFDKGFWMSKYLITQKQWQDVMGNNPSQFKGDNWPVETVSWDDAHAFIDALNTAYPGMGFRLPSESEWEYACRAGTTTRYYWGDDPDMSHVGDYAWYIENSDMVTHNVGQKLPNAWGLYDMSGNVWEWTQDRWHKNYTGAPQDGSAWETPTPGPAGRYVVRGASFKYEDYHCQSAVRGSNPYNAAEDLGFRLAKFD